MDHASSKSLSLKYHKSTPSGCKDIEIWKISLVVLYHIFLWLKLYLSKSFYRNLRYKPLQVSDDELNINKLGSFFTQMMINSTKLMFLRFILLYSPSHTVYDTMGCWILSMEQKEKNLVYMLAVNNKYKYVNYCKLCLSYL